MAFTFGRQGAALVLSVFLSGTAIAQVATPSAQLVVPTGATYDSAPGSTLSLACGELDVEGVFNVGSGQLINVGDVSIGATGTINGGSGTIGSSGNWSNNGTFVPGSGTVVITDGCAAGPIQITGTTVFNNLTLTSANGRTFVLPAGANITVNGTLTLQGTTEQPIQLVSASGQTAVIGLGPQAHVVRNFATVAGTVQIGAAIPIPPQAIPTLNAYGLMVLALLLATMLFWRGGPGIAGFKR